MLDKEFLDILVDLSKHSRLKPSYRTTVEECIENAEDEDYECPPHVYDTLTDEWMRLM